MNNIKATYFENDDTLQIDMRTDEGPLHLFTYELSKYLLSDRIDNTLQKFTIAQFTNSACALPIDRK